MNIKKILKNEYVSYFLILIIVVASVGAFWLTIRFAYQTEYPLLAVSSGSMEPTLMEGDLILVQGGLNASLIKVGYKDADPEGDIIVFHKPGQPDDLIVHRAIKNATDENGDLYFTTGGDNNIAKYGRLDDWKITPDLIVGKVVGRASWLGRVALFLHDPAGRLIVIIILIALIAIDLAYPSKKKKEEPQQKAGGEDAGSESLKTNPL